MDNILNDLYYEHEAQHYSDDWERLKDKCSECFKSIQSIRKNPCRKFRLEQCRSPFAEKLAEIEREKNTNPFNAYYE